MSVRSLTFGAATVATAAALVLARPAPGTPAALAAATRITSLPYTISSPGLYVVTSNLTGVSGSHGITVSSNDVTLDLCGYSLFGVSGSLDGVHVDPAVNVCVRNGGVHGWGSAGVDALDALACLFEDLFLADNGDSGLWAGSEARVEGVLAHDNAGDGVFAEGTAVECLSEGNAGKGFDHQGLLLRSSARSNGEQGVRARSSSRVESCVALDNTGDGFASESFAGFSSCLAAGNGGRGVSGSTGTRIAECLSARNGDEGFLLEADSTLERCLAADNGQQTGMLAGIAATGDRNRIDQNEAHGNPIGVQVSGADNTVVRNGASDNGTAYSVASGNYFFTGPPSAPNGWVNLSH